MSRVIFESDDSVYRITEHADSDYDLDNLKGDCFASRHHPEICPEKLKREEREFESLVITEGVYGYVLERWNPKPGHGWEHVDSCWGFVGPFPSFDHYIVEEMLTQIGVAS